MSDPERLVDWARKHWDFQAEADGWLNEEQARKIRLCAQDILTVAGVDFRELQGD